jgi:hypothetical protein
MENLLGTTLLSEFLNNQIINFLIKLNNMVPLILVIHMTEAYLWVFRTNLDFNSILVC